MGIVKVSVKSSLGEFSGIKILPVKWDTEMTWLQLLKLNGFETKNFNPEKYKIVTFGRGYEGKLNEKIQKLCSRYSTGRASYVSVTIEKCEDKLIIESKLSKVLNQTAASDTHSNKVGALQRFANVTVSQIKDVQEELINVFASGRNIDMFKLLPQTSVLLLQIFTLNKTKTEKDIEKSQYEEGVEGRLKISFIVKYMEPTDTSISNYCYCDPHISFCYLL